MFRGVLTSFIVAIKIVATVSNTILPLLNISLLIYFLNDINQRGEAQLYDSLPFHRCVRELITNDRSLMKIIVITVTVKFPISAVSNETNFFVVEVDASRNTTESEAKSSTRKSSFETPAIFSSQGSKRYKPITAAKDTPKSC